MGVRKTLLCLANSRKNGGRCVAGIEFDDDRPGSWIRPVSKWEGQAVPLWMQQYTDRAVPEVLDIVSVPLLEAVPERHQSENWLLDTTQRWVKIGVANGNDLLDIPFHTQLWHRDSSSQQDERDRVAVHADDGLTDSLRWIRATSVRLLVKGGHLRAEFSVNGIRYCLRVTDPTYERRYTPRGNGVYPLGASYLTVSLGQPFDGYCYKLVAAIIEYERVAGGQT